MNNWFLPSVAALVFWGIWGFLPKVASSYLPPKSIFIFQAIGNLIVIISVLISVNFRPEVNTRGFYLSLLAGVSVGLGTLFFLHALGKGKASVVVAITALYPLITIFLSMVFLKERLTLYQVLGVGFSLVALALFFKQ